MNQTKSMEFFENELQSKTILVIGYGSIGKCFVKILLEKFPKMNLIVIDQINPPSDISSLNFQYIQLDINRENVQSIFKYLKRGDILVELSTYIDSITVWSICNTIGIAYINTACMPWGDIKGSFTKPKTVEDLYGFSHGSVQDLRINHPQWNTQEGATAVFEFGMNPGLISHCVKKGIMDAAKYFLKSDSDDLDKEKIKFYIETKNIPKLALELKLETIHCSEFDDQWIDNPPTNLTDKIYNTWSCLAFIFESMLPSQIARGSHEDLQGSEQFPRYKNLILSYSPAKDNWCKSWVPSQNIVGCLIPHPEAYSLHSYLLDKETGYVPSQYYVYDYNPYAKAYFNSLKPDVCLAEMNPEWEVINPKDHKLHGYDKVGAMLIFKNNKGWWTGSLMDDNDSKKICRGEFGPTSLQVAAGVYSSFLWILKNPNLGNRMPEDLDTDFIFEHASEFLGQVYSDYVDLTQTHLKDCHKFEDYYVSKK